MRVAESLWCRCGGSLKVSSTQAEVVAGTAGSFRQVHVEPGCSVTDDPITGRLYARKARLRTTA